MTLHKQFDRFQLPYVDVRFDLATGYEDRPFKLLNEVVYSSAYTEPSWTIINKGYRTDFASIPRFFWRLFPPFGKYAGAAIVHDFFCDNKTVDYKTASLIFLEAMIDLNVPRWKRWVMYKAVLWFGPKWA